MTFVDRYIVSRPDYYAGFVSFGDEDLRQWKNIHSRLLHNCSKVWDAVKEVLCFDSPEGHVVIEPDDDGPDVGVKDTLSFCWRALKEARYACPMLNGPMLTMAAL